MSSEEMVYDMSGARLALTLCITKGREGAEPDTAALERMYRALRFESTVKRDPPAQVPSHLPNPVDQKDTGEMLRTEQVLTTMFQELPKIPTFTDTLHVYSTVEDKGYITYRNVKEGSCFIQTLVDVFITGKSNILDLLTEVTRWMAEAELVWEGQVRKVNPEIYSTLRKQLYLQ
ncbi:caspase-14-like [Tachyglossus aculeatus]|uniref:caspase-14-like n=1 Tax=Tachyglossus aculeatus TaxID=9261 RepID=UPI0018F28661|nr:caspase-14-like [Tachyglossus aculeatus]